MEEVKPERTAKPVGKLSQSVDNMNKTCFSFNKLVKTTRIPILVQDDSEDDEDDASPMASRYSSPT